MLNLELEEMGNFVSSVLDLQSQAFQILSELLTANIILPRPPPTLIREQFPKIHKSRLELSTPINKIKQLFIIHAAKHSGSWIVLSLGNQVNDNRHF